MTGLPVIQMLWIGDGLSKLEQLAVRSFLAHGHPVHVYTYGAEQLRGLPGGAVQKDGAEVMAWDDRFLQQPNGITTFSDVFRYMLLAQNGGWWCDCDVIALRPFPTPKHIVFASERHSDGSTHPVPGIMFCPPGDPEMHYLSAVARSRDPGKIEWCEVGPDLVAKVVEERNLHDRVIDHQAFCPLDVFNWQDALLDGIAMDFGPESFAVHLWHEIWKRYGVAKDADHPPGSLYETLKRRYGVL